MFVRHWDHGGVGHGRMGEQNRLPLGGSDLQVERGGVLRYIAVPLE